MVYETDMGCVYGFGSRIVVCACNDTDSRLEGFMVLEETGLVITRKHP